jgi:hypothetical protein
VGRLTSSHIVAGEGSIPSEHTQGRFPEDHLQAVMVARYRRSFWSRFKVARKPGNKLKVD